MAADLRESIIHGLRSRGWSKIEAENEADERIARGRQASPPYPFCRTPEKCAGKGYCDAEFACND